MTSEIDLLADLIIDSITNGLPCVLRNTKNILEEWRSIEGYPNYQVSDQGRIRNVKKDRVLKSRIRKDGYSIVALRKDGNATTFTVHRIVASAFIPNPENKPLVDHVDGNKANNTVNNLRRCTCAENNQNSRIPITNTSGYKGVTFVKRLNKYKAMITYNGEKIYLGLHSTAKEAHEAYKKAAIKYHGEFARFE